MSETTYTVIDSTVDETAALYKNVKVTKSTVGAGTTIGDNSIIYDCRISPHVSINRGINAAYSSVGYGTYINHNTTLRNADIGKFCSISWNVSIGGKDHDYMNIAQYPPYWWKKLFSLDDVKDERDFKTCKIGNDVWIGSGANILREVEIGNGAVIAAGAVVTKDVEPYSIVIGAPARFYKKRFSDEEIRILQRIQWWDWPFEVLKENADLFNSHISRSDLEKLERISRSI